MTTSKSVEFGIALPQVFEDSPVDPAGIAQFAERAEALGYSCLWTQDQLLGTVPVLDGLTTLSFIASRTTTIRLGVSVVVLSHRDPVPLAKMIASIDQLSGGRLELGVGLGNANPQDRALGIRAEVRGERLRRFRDNLRALKALWSDGVATVDGSTWPLRATPMEPKPLQRPHPPLWFGGRHPNALRRAAREADGWMGAGSSTTQDFVAQSAAMRETLAEEGREAASFRIAKRLYVAVDDNESRAEQRIRQWFDAYYGNADMGSRVSVCGSPKKIQDAVGALTDAGAEVILLAPVFDFSMHQEVLADTLHITNDQED